MFDTGRDEILIFVCLPFLSVKIESIIMAENNNAPETKRVDKEIEAAEAQEPKVRYFFFSSRQSTFQVLSTNSRLRRNVAIVCEAFV